MLSATTVKRSQIGALFLIFPILIWIGSYEIACPEDHEQAQESNSDHYAPCKIVLVRIQHAGPKIDTHATDQNQNKDHLSSVVTFFIDLIWRSINDALAIITFFLAVYTYKLWRSTGELVRDTKETSEKHLRSYVCFNQFLVAYGFGKDNKTLEGYVFNVEFSNVGVTPATDVRTYTILSLLPRKNGISQEPDFSQVGPRGPSSTMGPRSTSFTIHNGIELSKIIQQWENKLDIYFFSRIEYRDIFSPDILHFEEKWNRLIALTDPRIIEGMPAGHILRFQPYGDQSRTG